MADVDGSIVLGLDIAQTTNQLNKDLSTVISNLEKKKIELSVKLKENELNSMVSRLSTQIKPIKADIQMGNMKEAITSMSQLDNVIERLKSKYTEINGRDPGLITLRRIEETKNALAELGRVDVLSKFSESLDKICTSEGLRELALIPKSIIEGYDSIKSFGKIVNDQFKTSIKSIRDVDSGFMILIKHLQEYSKAEGGYFQTKSVNLMNYLDQNLSSAEKQILWYYNNIQKLKGELTGISADYLYAVDYTDTFGLDCLTVNENINDLYNNLLKLHSEYPSAKAEQDAFFASLIEKGALMKDGALEVTLEQLQAVVDKFPQAKQYIDEIKSRITELGASNSVSNKPFDPKFNIDKTSIDAVQQELNRLKVDPLITNTFLQHLDDIGIRVDRIQGKWINVADSEERALSLSIQGTDQYQRTVSLLETYDTEGKQIESTQKSITLNVQKQREEQERLAKQTTQENDSRLSYLTKQQSVLDSIQSKYSGETSTKGILDSSHLDALNNKYSEIQNKIKSFTELSGGLSKTQKAEIESQIASLERMVKTYQNAEYVATSLRTKDVNTINSEQLDKLNAYEEKLRASGILTNEFQQKISSLRSELGNAFDSASLTSYLNNFDGLQSNVAALQEKIRNVNSLYVELGKISANINSVQQKMISLDPNKESDRIAALQQELNLYQQQEAEVRAQISAYGEIINLSQQRQAYEQQAEVLAAKLSVAEAEVADKARAVDTAMQNMPQTIERIEKSFEQLRTKPQEISEQVSQLRVLMDAVSSANTEQKKISAYNQLKEAIQNCKKGISDYAAIEKSAAQSDQLQSRTKTLSNNIQAWMNQNQQAAQKFGDELRKLLSMLNSGNLNSSDLRTAAARFNEIKSEAKAAGLSTNIFAESLKNTAKQLLGLNSGVMIIRRLIQVIKQAASTVVELDTALVDLKKTTTMSDSDLSAFYKDANKAAKELGVTTKDIIQSASDWSRLGFSDKNSAETMAKLAAQFSAISPGVDIDQATTGLVSTIKAYGIEVDDVLDGVMSKINIIGNTAATSNDQIITGLQNSASAMAAMNSTLEENIALFTAAQEITQDDSKVGNALRSIAMRTRGELLNAPYVQKCA